jgi:hypothetical protein
MAKLPEMTKHRGIPSGLPGTGFQFTIRRANPRGVTPIIKRERMATGRRRRNSPTPPSCMRCGTSSATNRSSAAISMPAGSAGCSGARSCPPNSRSIRPPIRRCSGSTKTSPGGGSVPGQSGAMSVFARSTRSAFEDDGADEEQFGAGQSGGQARSAQQEPHRRLRLGSSSIGLLGLTRSLARLRFRCGKGMPCRHTRPRNTRSGYGTPARVIYMATWS